MAAQFIGLDVGFGFTKGFTVVNGKSVEEIFESYYSFGTEMDWREYDNYLSIFGVTNEHEVPSYYQNVWVGRRAKEVDGIAYTENSKTSEIVQILMAAMLNKLAFEEEVYIMLGIPDKLFNEENYNKVKSKFQNKEFKIEDSINKTFKKVIIKDIYIYREGLAVHKYLLSKDSTLENVDVGIITTGYETTELVYIKAGKEFDENRSKTYNIGNKLAIEYSIKRIENGEYPGYQELSHYELDTDPRHAEFNEVSYKNISSRILSRVNSIWKNQKTMKIFVAGGTPLNKGFNLGYPVIEDSQKAAARGLYLACVEKFGGSS